MRARNADVSLAILDTILPSLMQLDFIRTAPDVLFPLVG